MICILVLVIANHFDNKSKEKYDKDYAKYTKCGKIVAGTVYSINPYDVPGLGWVL